MAKGVSLRIEHKAPTGGLNAKGRAYLKAKTGSNLQAPVTKKSGLSPRQKARRKSFCALLCAALNEEPSRISFFIISICFLE